MGAPEKSQAYSNLMQEYINIWRVTALILTYVFVLAAGMWFIGFRKVSSTIMQNVRGYVMLTYWIPERLCMLPANASHHVGVGGFVINDNNEVLVIQERHCSPARVDFWKIPTGFIFEIGLRC